MCSKHEVMNYYPDCHLSGIYGRQYKAMALICPLVLLMLITGCGICLGSTVACMVTAVEDGDTLIITDDNVRLHKVDLYGIDAPELGQEGGVYAAELLSKMVNGKRVLVTVIGKDQRDTPHIKLAVNGASVNGAMVKAGYAWVVPLRCHQSECKKWKTYQRGAGRQKRGLWILHNAVEPWNWRGRYEEMGPQYPGEVTVTSTVKSEEVTPIGKRVIVRKETGKSFVRRGKTSINAYQYRPQNEKYLWRFNEKEKNRN